MMSSPLSSRLFRQHPEVSPEHLARLVADAAESLASARIHDFLAVLIERRVTDALVDEPSGKDR